MLIEKLKTYLSVMASAEAAGSSSSSPSTAAAAGCCSCLLSAIFIGVDEVVTLKLLDRLNSGDEAAAALFAVSSLDAASILRRRGGRGAVFEAADVPLVVGCREAKIK